MWTAWQRYIYIHGTADTEVIGKPHSHGCIRMRNKDVIELFDMVPLGTKVYILEGLDTDEDDVRRIWGIVPVVFGVLLLTF